MKILAICLTALVITGCDYVAREAFDIETVDGRVITLLCPVVDPYRSTAFYIIDGHCVIAAPHQTGESE